MSYSEVAAVSMLRTDPALRSKPERRIMDQDVATMKPTRTPTRPMEMVTIRLSIPGFATVMKRYPGGTVLRRA